MKIKEKQLVRIKHIPVKSYCYDITSQYIEKVGKLTRLLLKGLDGYYTCEIYFKFNNETIYFPQVKLKLLHDTNFREKSNIKGERTVNGQSVLQKSGNIRSFKKKISD